MSKRNKLSQQQNVDDEQIEKTLNFFDSILDPYLNDYDTLTKKFDYQIVPAYSMAIPSKKHDANVSRSSTDHRVGPPSANPRHSASSSSPAQRPAYLNFRNVHPRSEQLTPAAPAHHVRRYTSENNLNRISSPSKPSKVLRKTSPPEPVRTSVASTGDLLKTPLWRNYSPQARRSQLTGKNNGTSASLIDLTAIDKVSSRPRYRFIPPSNSNHILREEPEIGQQQQQRFNPRADQFHHKATSSNQAKYSHKIFKPTVIIPPKPKSAPVTRLTETNIHHQTDNSAFKPPRSSKNANSAKVQQPTAPNMKRTEPIHKLNPHIGMANSSNQLSNSEFLFRYRQAMPQFHQSMLDLSSSGVPDMRNTNMFGSRILYQPPSSKFMRSPPYVPQSKKFSRHYQYPPPPPPPAHFDDSIKRRIQHVNNSSNMNGLAHSPYRQPFTNGGGGGGNRSQPQSYPYNPYISNASGLSSARNTYDHLRRQQPYLNPVKVHKHHSPLNPASVQSPHLSSLPSSTTDSFPVPPSNIYHFNQNISSDHGQSPHYLYHENMNLTTYL